MSWLAAHSVVAADTLDWLREYRFGGSIDAYAEGELYTAGSPVLTVRGGFGQSVLLETLVLSILNFDSAIAAAAELIVRASAGRPVIEMGTRRTDAAAAVAAARASWLVGFGSTSNLEAGRRYGIPTAGTSAHAFVLAHGTERQAFAAQVAALGPSTTLLVDTYDLDQGIRNAVAVAGPELGAVRIDSGDLAGEAWRARALLDELGAPNTRVTVTGDLDDVSIRGLAPAPVDGYGVGTSLVTGLGAPTAGFVYKLVSIGDEPGAAQRAVAKRSPGKATVGGRKWAWRARLDRLPEHWEGPPASGAGPFLADIVSTSPADRPADSRPLQAAVVVDGERQPGPDLARSRSDHLARRADLPDGAPLILVRP